MSDILADLFNGCRRKVVRLLLAGNDTGCFTEEQYQAKYFELWPTKNEELLKISRAELWASNNCARKHLRSMSDLIEVGNGVWARKEQQP